MRPGDLIVVKYHMVNLFRYSGFRWHVGDAFLGETFMVTPYDLPPRYTDEVRILHHQHGVVYISRCQIDLLQSPETAA